MVDTVAIDFAHDTPNLPPESVEAFWEMLRERCKSFPSKRLCCESKSWLGSFFMSGSDHPRFIALHKLGAAF